MINNLERAAEVIGRSLSGGEPKPENMHLYRNLAQDLSDAGLLADGLPSPKAVATGRIIDAKWSAEKVGTGSRSRHLPVFLKVAIPADQLGGIDLTEGITITQ